MEQTQANSLTSANPIGFEPGLTIEHILLSVTVVSNNESAGQFDDSAAYQVQKGLNEYHGVERVNASVHYKHTKIEQHPKGCDCHWCKLPEKPDLDPDGNPYHHDDNADKPVL